MKKSQQITQHQHLLVAGGGSYDVEAVALEVQNTMLTHEKGWDTMDKDEKVSICQFVLDNIAAMPSGKNAAPLPEIADVVTAFEELCQKVLFLFAVFSLLYIQNIFAVYSVEFHCVNFIINLEYNAAGYGVDEPEECGAGVRCRGRAVIQKEKC